MQQLLFQPDEYQHPKLYLFKETELGRIHLTIPWDILDTCLPEQDITKPGPFQFLSNAGMFGLMFLKHILNISDEKLIERFNTDWSCQLFCGKLLGDDEKVRNTAYVSNIRSYIAHNADLDCIQEILLNHWEGDMEMTQALFMPACLAIIAVRLTAKRLRNALICPLIISPHIDPPISLQADPCVSIDIDPVVSIHTDPPVSIDIDPVISV